MRAATTKATTFDAELSGFCTTMLRLAATTRSGAPRGVVQLDGESQTVLRALPPMSREEPGPGLVARKFPPVTRSVNPPAAPAVMLAGCRERIVGCRVMVTAAEAARLISSELVAVTLRVFGEGAIAGAR